MLETAKRISFFLHNRPRIITICWILVCSFLLIASISRELTARASEFSKNIPSLLEAATIQDEPVEDRSVQTLILTVSALICSIYCGTKSFLVLISLLLSTLIAASLLHLTNSMIELDHPVALLLMVTSSVTVTNVLGVMKNWDNSRRGPSASTINRLLLSTVDKSIVIFIWTTVAVLIITLPALALDPIRTGPSLAILILCIIIQNVCSSCVLICLLLIKHDCSLACPTDPRALVRSVAYRVEEKIVYIHHFLHSNMHRFLSSVGKYFILGTFCLSAASCLTLISYQAVQSLNYSTNVTTLETECVYPICINRVLLFPLVLLIPLPILFFSNITRPFGLLAYLSVVHVVLVDATLQILLNNSFSPLQNFLLLVLAVDSPLRMSLQQAASRKRKLLARILDALDTQFPQTAMAMLIMQVMSAVGILFFNHEIWLHSAIVSFISFLTTNLFLPAAMIVIGSSSYCGIPPDRESIAHSESRSQYTDALLHISHIEMDRRSSAVTGIYKKRSFCSLPAETRRASMPVIMHHKTSQRRWCELTKNNRSIDSNGCGSPPSGSSSRIILKKEPLLNSRGSLISNVSSLQSYIIKEEDPANV